jgi:hypothetical protein
MDWRASWVLWSLCPFCKRKKIMAHTLTSLDQCRKNWQNLNYKAFNVASQLANAQLAHAYPVWRFVMTYRFVDHDELWPIATDQFPAARDAYYTQTLDTVTMTRAELDDITRKMVHPFATS